MIRIRLIFLLVFILTATLSGREDLRLEPGCRIRFSTRESSDDWIIANLVATDTDTLTFSSETGKNPSRVPVSSISKIEVSLGSKPRTFRGAAIGFGVGAAVGALLVRGNSENDLSDRDAALLGAGTFSIAGAVIGAVLGARESEEQWQSVDLNAEPPPDEGSR